MDQQYEPLIVQAENQKKKETDVPPGTPLYSMGAFLASGRNSVAPPAPAPTAPPTQPTAPVLPQGTTLGDRARSLVDRATTGITNLFGGAVNAVQNAVTQADPFRIGKITVVPNSAADEANARFAGRNTVDLEKDLDDLEKRSTQVKAPQIIPNFYMTRITANKNFTSR